MKNFKHKPFWWDDAQLEQRNLAESLDALPAKVGTLIVGAGYSGLSAALTLARAGREVVIVDAEIPGYGCSGRNGGLVGPTLHKLSLKGLAAAHGESKTTAILHESMKILEYLKEFIKSENIDCDLVQKGRFYGAYNTKSYDESMQRSEYLNKTVGLEFEPIPKSEQHRQIGSDFYCGGVVYPDDSYLQPAKYIIGLCELALDAGVKIIAPARVTGVEYDGHRRIAHFGNRQVEAGQILIATNGYTGPELPYFHKRIIPIRSAIIATEELDPSIAAGLSPKGRGFGGLSRLAPYYRPSTDGKRLIFGGRTFEVKDRADRYAIDLKRLMTRIYPQLSNVNISHAWSGTVAYTFDHVPHLGEHDGIHYVMGYCGSGVARASYFGRMAALKMLGRGEGKTELDGLEFSTRLFYNGKPWFLPYILRWHSFADRFGR